MGLVEAETQHYDLKSCGILTCGGDFNVKLNDKPNTRQTKANKKINAFRWERGITDVWRDFDPAGRGYTFSSHPHCVYREINYFFNVQYRGTWNFFVVILEILIFWIIVPTCNLN